MPTQTLGYYSVALPSFFASIENESNLNYFFSSSFRQNQVFATGEAANLYANKPSIQQAAFENMNPNAAKIEENGLNASLLAEIEKIYGNADDVKKETIETTAFKLGLIDKLT